LRNASRRSNSARLLATPEQGVVVRQPEAAGEEGAFSLRQPVRSRAGVVSQDQSVADEPPRVGFAGLGFFPEYSNGGYAVDPYGDGCGVLHTLKHDDAGKYVGEQITRVCP